MRVRTNQAQRRLEDGWYFINGPMKSVLVIATDDDTDIEYSCREKCLSSGFVNNIRSQGASIMLS